MEPQRRHWALAIATALLLHAGVAAMLWQPAPSGAGVGRAGGITLVLGAGGSAAGDVAGASGDALVAEPEAGPVAMAEPSVEVEPTEAVEPPVALAEAPVELAEAPAQLAEPAVEALAAAEPLAEDRPVVEPSVLAAMATAPAPAPVPVEPLERAVAEERAEQAAAETPAFVAPPPRAKPERDLAVLARTDPAPPAPAAPADAAPDQPAPDQPVSDQPVSDGAPGEAALGEAIGQAGSAPAGAASDGAARGAAGAAVASTEAYDQYLAALQAWLERHKDYPRGARSRRQSGTALLHFVMDRAGRVVEHHLAASSGHEVLDRAVLAMLERAQPLPPMPDGLHQDQLEVVLPVQFALR